MNNQHRVILAFLMLATGCGSKESARPSDPEREARAPERAGGGTMEDCRKARSELARLDRCEGGGDEELAEEWRETLDALTSGKMADDARAMIIDSCKGLVDMMATMTCDNIKKQRRADD